MRQHGVKSRVNQLYYCVDATKVHPLNLQDLYTYHNFMDIVTGNGVGVGNVRVFEKDISGSPSARLFHCL
jgi:hypothetical protein